MNIRRWVSMFKRARFCFGETIKIKMSALSPTMESGTITEWHVKEGQKVDEEDSLALIETDKAKVKLQSPEAGFVAKINYPDGAKDIAVGEVIAYLVEEEGDLQSFKPDEEESTKRETETPKLKEEKSPEGSNNTEKKEKKSQAAKVKKDYPPHVIIKMPSLSPTKEGGAIKEWKVKKGDKVDPDTSIASVETDKSTMDFKVTEDGFVAKILMDKTDEDIPGNTPLLVLAEEAGDIDAFADFVMDADNEKGDPAEIKESSKPSRQKSYDKNEGLDDESKEGPQQDEAHLERLFISPRAKKLLREKDIDPSQAAIRGSGPNNRIIEEDVQSFLKSGAKTQVFTEIKAPRAKQQKESTQMPSSEFEEIIPNNVRKVIAQRLSQSKRDIPHYYLESVVDMGNLIEFKNKLFSETQKKISVNAFIVKACALACQDVPEANSQWIENTIRKFKNSDVCFAVDTPNGLITPLIKEANNKSLSHINGETHRLIEKARDGELQPNEYMVL